MQEREKQARNELNALEYQPVNKTNKRGSVLHAVKRPRKTRKMAPKCGGSNLSRLTRTARSMTIKRKTNSQTTREAIAGPSGLCLPPPSDSDTDSEPDRPNLSWCQFSLLQVMNFLRRKMKWRVQSGKGREKEKEKGKRERMNLMTVLQSRAYVPTTSGDLNNGQGV